MNIANLHTAEKKVSAVKLENDGQPVLMAIRILKDEILAKHLTKIPAVLICISGETVYETEKGEKQVLETGDYVNIKPNVVHWLKAIKESQLLLIR